MSYQNIASILKGLSAVDLKIIDELLNARKQQSYLSANSSESESDVSLVDDYSSDDEESEPVLKKKAGRPKKIRTKDEIAALKTKIETKESRRIEREMKSALKSDEAVAKQQRIKLKKEAALTKKAEKEQNALELLKKRTEKYGKMLADAEAYKAKWNL